MNQYEEYRLCGEIESYWAAQRLVGKYKVGRKLTPKEVKSLVFFLCRKINLKHLLPMTFFG